MRPLVALEVRIFRPTPYTRGLCSSYATPSRHRSKCSLWSCKKHRERGNKSVVKRNCQRPSRTAGFLHLAARNRLGIQHARAGNKPKMGWYPSPTTYPPGRLASLILYRFMTMVSVSVRPRFRAFSTARATLYQQPSPTGQWDVAGGSTAHTLRQRRLQLSGFNLPFQIEGAHFRHGAHSWLALGDVMHAQPAVGAMQALPLASTLWYPAVLVFFSSLIFYSPV